jgi:mannose-6-phosphate isomerase
MVIKPWGSYKVLLNLPHCKVKQLIVNPEQKLSYQYHDKRAEVWTIVAGSATIILDDEKVFRNYGETIRIPKGSKHRIINEDKFKNLEIIEVQHGTYFGEDDIVRIKDEYNRI